MGLWACRGFAGEEGSVSLLFKRRSRCVVFFYFICIYFSSQALFFGSLSRDYLLVLGSKWAALMIAVYKAA